MPTVALREGWTRDHVATFWSLRLRAGDAFAVEKPDYLFVLLDDVLSHDDEVRCMLISAEVGDPPLTEITFRGWTNIDNNSPFALFRAST